MALSILFDPVFRRLVAHMKSAILFQQAVQDCLAISMFKQIQKMHHH